jgi:hypothetical protein
MTTLKMLLLAHCILAFYISRVTNADEPKRVFNAMLLGPGSYVDALDLGTVKADTELSLAVAVTNISNEKIVLQKPLVNGATIVGEFRQVEIKPNSTELMNFRIRFDKRPIKTSGVVSLMFYPNPNSTCLFRFNYEFSDLAYFLDTAVSKSYHESLNSLELQFPLVLSDKKSIDNLSLATEGELHLNEYTIFEENGSVVARLSIDVRNAKGTTKEVLVLKDGKNQTLSKMDLILRKLGNCTVLPSRPVLIVGADSLNSMSCKFLVKIKRLEGELTKVACSVDEKLGSVKNVKFRKLNVAQGVDDIWLVTMEFVPNRDLESGLTDIPAICNFDFGNNSVQTEIALGLPGFRKY